MPSTKRHHIPCRICGKEHSNPRSSSICHDCGKAMAFHVAARSAEEAERPWDELSWEERYDRDPRQAFIDLAEALQV